LVFACTPIPFLLLRTAPQTQWFDGELPSQWYFFILYAFYSYSLYVLTWAHQNPPTYSEETRQIKSSGARGCILKFIYRSPLKLYF
jgi:hypothetical protein